MEVTADLRTAARPWSAVSTEFTVSLKLAVSYVIATHQIHDVCPGSKACPGNATSREYI